MKRFEFKNYDIVIDIAGHQYTVRCDSEFGDLIKSFAKKYAECSKKIANGDISKENVLKMYLDDIDAIIGPGAADAIFTGRSKNISDANDVMMYIIGEANAFIAGNDRN